MCEKEYICVIQSHIVPIKFMFVISLWLKSKKFKMLKQFFKAVYRYSFFYIFSIVAFDCSTQKMSNATVKISKTQERNTAAAPIFLYIAGKFEKNTSDTNIPCTSASPLCASLPVSLHLIPFENWPSCHWWTNPLCCVQEAMKNTCNLLILAQGGKD